MVDAVVGLWWLWLLVASVCGGLWYGFWWKNRQQQAKGFVEPVTFTGCLTCLTAIVAAVGIVSAVLGIIALVLRLVVWKVGA